jgi:hypothetical protein
MMARAFFMVVFTRQVDDATENDADGGGAL